MRRLIVLLTALTLSATASASSLQTLTEHINQRLAVMKDVAGYKAQHHLAVEDLPREKEVLQQASARAEKAGLDAASVAPFIQAQMDVAKAIQYRYLADWLSQPEKNWQPQPLSEARQTITGLDAKLVDDLLIKLKSGGFSADDNTALLKQVGTHNMSDADKARLVTALTAIRLK